MMYRIKMYICPMYSKELLKGTLQVMILQLLAEQGSMYGYEIYQKVKELSDEKIILKDGSLYPALAKLHKDKLVQFKEVAVGKRKRKYYELTKQGQEQQVLGIEELKEFMATLSKVLFPNQNNYALN